MFKENWPLTGLVKLLNPAGGRRLRLIRQGGGLQSLSCLHQDPSLAGLMCQVTSEEEQFGGGQGNKTWADTGMAHGRQG